MPIKDNNKYNGNANADKIIFLTAKKAVAKYGIKAKYGAVEIYEKKSKLTFRPLYTIADTAKFPAPTLSSVPLPPPSPKKTKKPLAPPPPPPKESQVKFPPPIGDKFFPMRSVSPDGEINSVDQRFIVINGKEISDINKFFGVTNATKIVSLNGKNAIKKYGVAAKYGAIEITGRELKYVKSIADGPPPPIMTQVKFPPPIVKKDKP